MSGELWCWNPEALAPEKGMGRTSGMQRHNSPPSRKPLSRKPPYRKLIECQGEFGFAAVAADQVEGAVVGAHYLAGEA